MTDSITISTYPYATPTNVYSGSSFMLGIQQNVSAQVSTNQGYSEAAWGSSTFTSKPYYTRQVIEGTGLASKTDKIQTFNYGGFSLWSQMKAPEHYVNAWQGATLTFHKMYK